MFTDTQRKEILYRRSIELDNGGDDVGIDFEDGHYVVNAYEHGDPMCHQFLVSRYGDVGAWRAGADEFTTPDEKTIGILDEWLRGLEAGELDENGEFPCDNKISRCQPMPSWDDLMAGLAN